MTPRVLWFTGLSGAGKSTIANLVHERLNALHVPSVVLDGDEMRRTLCKDLGFSPADRAENVRRIAEVAQRLMRAGAVVSVACISPFAAGRLRARETIGTFAEIYVDAPLSVVGARDVKGLYARARRGEIPEFTGVSSPYEVPEHPELRLDTAALTAEECADRVLAYLLRIDVASERILFADA